MHVQIKGVLLLTLLVQKWGTDEVAAWLDLLSLGEYKEIFIRHDIRGSELVHLERRDLKVFPATFSFLWELNLFPVPFLLCAYSLASMTVCN